MNDTQGCPLASTHMHTPAHTLAQMHTYMHSYIHVPSKKKALKLCNLKQLNEQNI